MELNDVRDFNTQDVPGHKFVAARGGSLVYEVEGFDNVGPAITKIIRNAKYIAAKEGYNCIVNCNPDVKPYIPYQSNSHFIVSLNFTMGTLYD